MECFRLFFNILGRVGSKSGRGRGLKLKHVLNCQYRHFQQCHASVRRFFHRILEPTSYLHHLIPPKRTCSQTAKLRQSMPYSIPFARSERFRNSFILYSLNNYLYDWFGLILYLIRLYDGWLRNSFYAFLVVCLFVFIWLCDCQCVGLDL